MMRYRHPRSASRVIGEARYAITAVVLLVGVLACQAPTPTLEPTPTATATPTPTLAAATPTPTMGPPLPSTQSSEPGGKPFLEVSDVTCAPGQEASVDVRLSRVGDGGLAGYDMALALGPQALAKFVAVQFPHQGYGRSSELPDSSVNLSFLNTERAIQPGRGTRLVTLRLQCSQPGDGVINLTIRALDDERGAALDVDAKAGRITVSK